METIGFICSIGILLFATFSWGFMLIFDGAFGKREVPIWVTIITGALIYYVWSLVIDAAPFTIVAS